MQSILVLTSRFRDVCWGTKMKWLLWQLKLVLVVATCRVRAVLHHFYDEFFLHSKTFSANCVRLHYLQKSTVRLLDELYFYNSIVKCTIHSRNREDIRSSGLLKDTIYRQLSVTSLYLFQSLTNMSDFEKCFQLLSLVQFSKSAVICQLSMMICWYERSPFWMNNHAI